MNLIQTLPEPSASNTNVTWTERLHESRAETAFQVTSRYEHQGRRFVVKVDSCFDTIFTRKRDEELAQAPLLMAKQAATILKKELAGWMAVVNPIDNTVPKGFVEACEGPAKQETPLDWTASVMTMDEWQRRFGANFGYMSDAAIKEHTVCTKPTEPEILSVHYFTAAEGIHGAQSLNFERASRFDAQDPLNRLTFCVITLKNGTQATGASTRGRRYAHDNAAKQLISPQQVNSDHSPLGVFP